MSDRLRRYEDRTSPALLGLAVVFIGLYALPVLEPDLPKALATTVEIATVLIWLCFAGDLAVRVSLAERRWHYLFTHPIDVAAVVLPALRPLRVLRVFTAGHVIISRAGRFSLFRSSEVIAFTAGLLIFVSALAMLDAERGSADANIRTFDDALWWATTTVTTVGYGDHYPATGTGRLVAAALMLVGISLVGVITASVAAWFISRTAASEAQATDVERRLERVEQALNDLVATLGKDPPPEGGGNR